MFKKKEKRFLSKIKVKLHNWESEEKNQYYTIELAPDESYKIPSIGGDLYIYSGNGSLKKRYNWQAGHTVEYSFFYKPLEWYDDSDGEA